MSFNTFFPFFHQNLLLLLINVQTSSTKIVLHLEEILAYLLILIGNVLHCSVRPTP